MSGAGIALRSTWDIAAELRTGKLVRVLPGYEGAAEIGIYAVRPRAELVPPDVLAFANFLGRLYSPAPPWERAA